MNSPSQKEMEQMFLASGLEHNMVNWEYFVEGVLGINKPDQYSPPEVHAAYAAGEKANALFIS